MTFRRGAALTTATTLGHAETSDRGPTEGTGVYRRWPDDLAALQEAGVTDVRITLDWARLQPKPGVIDDAWAEWFEQFLTATDAIDLRAWIALHDGSLPKWFDNDGGFGDADNFTRWWPRWVGLAADRFGDHARGWVPFAELPARAAWQTPWTDTWNTLRGTVPVVPSIDPNTIDPATLADEERDAVGLVLSIDVDPEHIGRTLRDVADATDASLVVSSLRCAVTADRTVDGGRADAPNVPNDDELTHDLAAAVLAIDDAIDDGVEVSVAFADPAIAMPRCPALLLDAERRRSPASGALLP